MRIDVITVFPDYLAPAQLSLIGRAAVDNIIDLRVHDLRDWTTDRHRTVDDTPTGGGAGMLMRPDVWGAALDDIIGDDQEVEILFPNPAGQVFNQTEAHRLSAAKRMIICCGRYEGIDARVAQHYAERGFTVREVSLGDYVLNGGEVAALAIIEAVVRLVPGVVGNPESLVDESHGAAGLLEAPAYTKPQEWRGLSVPEVLLSGHHSNIARWRRDQALRRTAQRRPDLLERLSDEQLSKQDRIIINELKSPSPPADAAGGRGASSGK